MHELRSEPTAKELDKILEIASNFYDMPISSHRNTSQLVSDGKQKLKEAEWADAVKLLEQAIPSVETMNINGKEVA